MRQQRNQQAQEQALGQLSLLEAELLPQPQRAQAGGARGLLPLQGPALEVAMRRVWQRWSRWHPCASFEEAVRDGVTRRLLELAADKAARCASRQGLSAAD